MALWGLYGEISPVAAISKRVSENGSLLEIFFFKLFNVVHEYRRKPVVASNLRGRHIVGTMP
jgi:hypothetical protein